MDPNISIRSNREVNPEFSDPTDYSEFQTLNNLTNPNIKQGMKFVNKGKVSTQRFQPYNQPTNSINNNNNNSKARNSFYRPNVSGNETKTQFGSNDKSNNEKQVLKMPSSSQKFEQKPTSSYKDKNKRNPGTIRFTMDNSKNDDQLRSRLNLPGNRFRHLIGSVDQVLRWYKSVKNSDFWITYEATGILECVRSQNKKQLLFVRGDSGQILQGVFYEIDRLMPQFNPKSFIIVTGRMIGFKKMHVLDISILKEGDQQAIQRLAFLSQRALDEAIN